MSDEAKVEEPAAGAPAPLAKRFRRDRRASTLIEFGLIALPFFALLMAILEVGYTLYASVALESAVEHAARDVFIGSAKLSSYTNIQQFIDGELCDPNAGSDYALLHSMNCSLVAADLRVVTAGFSSETFVSPSQLPISNGVIDTSSFVYQPGGPGSIVLLRAFYPLQLHSSILGAPGSVTLQGGQITRILSSAATFKNEP